MDHPPISKLEKSLAALLLELSTPVHHYVASLASLPLELVWKILDYAPEAVVHLRLVSII